LTFNSLQYAAFFPAVLAVYWSLRSTRAKNGLLLVASYVFYGLFDYRFLGLVALSTVTDYSVGRLLGRTEDEGRRRLIFAVSLAVNFGVLGTFKYFNFFVSSSHRLLHALGIELTSPAIKVLLPVGISFYTLHGVSYTFDVFRRHVAPTRNLLSFAVFVAFFPQLVAGPIGRAHLQLPQFERERPPLRWDDIRSGCFLIFLGLFRKVVIADAMAPFVNRAFGPPSPIGWVDLLVGVYAFALQIYGDFCGYSDIARGSARLLGIELPVNFRQPYLSRSITEFWRRWHISLSSWLRDYLYVPLGGNRRSATATYRNLMITMLLGGLWHGAAWTFVVWGGLHGLFLAAERAWRGGTTAQVVTRGAGSRLRSVVAAIATFHLVCLAWVFFRAPSLHEALVYLKGIVTMRAGAIHGDAIAVLVPTAIAALAIDLVQRHADAETALLRWQPLSRGVAFATMLLLIVVFSGGTPVPFIYFRF